MYLIIFTLLLPLSKTGLQRSLPELASDPKTMVVYDHFNFLDRTRVRDQACLGSSKNIMQNLRS